MEEPFATPLRRAPVRVQPYRCLRVRHYRSRCDACEGACPRRAISLDPGPVVDAARCNGCGVCAAVCPTATLELRGVDEAAVVAAAVARGGDIACLHAAGARGAQVPCLGFLDVGALLALAAEGARVSLETGPCTACPEAAGLAALRRAVVEANAILGHYGAENRIEYRQSRGYSAGASVSRRDLFAFARRKAAERLVPDPEVPATPVDKGTAIRGALRPPRRALLLEALQRLQAQATGYEPEAGKAVDYGSLPACEGSPVALPFFAVSIAEACDNCGMCLTFCPTGALRVCRTPGTATLAFCADFCLGCELCAGVCPQKAVRLERLTAPPRLGHEAILLARPARRCARCGVEFAAVAGEGLCPACARRRSLDDAIRRTLFG